MSIKTEIIKELEYFGDWEFSGKLCRKVADLLKRKESNVERRCRELVESGWIEKKLVDNPQGGNQVVMYRIKKLEVPPQYRVENVKQLNLI